MSARLTSADLCPEMFHVHKVEVKRLRGDRSEIRPGDEAAFVATAKFRLNQPAENDDTTKLDALKREFPEAQVGADLLSINEDGELVSSVPMDEDDIEGWLKDTFCFEFRLDGADGPPRYPKRGPLPKPEDSAPWITLLDTASISGDYFDLEADIFAREGPGTQEPSPDQMLRFRVELVPPDGEPSLWLTAALERETLDKFTGTSWPVNIGGLVTFSLSGDDGEPGQLSPPARPGREVRPARPPTPAPAAPPASAGERKNKRVQHR